jgi:hypothetical protein
MSSTTQLSVGAVGPVRVHFANITDLESIPNSAGWYAWFYIPCSTDTQSFLLHRHTKVQSIAKGIFNLSFEGMLKIQNSERPLDFGHHISAENLQILQSLCLAFAPPLYIGISKRLQHRLKTHRKNLQDCIIANTTPPDVGVLLNNDPLSDADTDTDTESLHFGGRIGVALQEFGLSADDLYVKCVESSDTTNLKSIEKALNFALTPHYGRR